MILSHEELHEEIKGASSSVLDQLRWFAKNNRFFLAKGVLGYKDVNERTHADLCRFLDEETSIRRLTLMPRGTLKTTISTIAGTVEDIIRDPLEARTLIAHENALVASSIMEEAKAHFTNPGSNLVLMFPELLVTKTQGQGITWNSEMATIPIGGRIHKDPHMLCAGVGTTVTGRHFTKIRPDDLIGFDAKESQAEMEFAIRWAKNLTALLVNPSEHIIDFVGTHWKPEDLYFKIIEYFGEQMAVFSRGCWHEDGNSIFPSRLTKAFLDHLRIDDPEQYYAQYENNPIEGGKRDFAQKPYDFTVQQGYIVYTFQGVQKRIHLDHCDRFIIADPAGDKTFTKGASRNKSDLAAIVALAVAPDDCLFVLQSESRRYTPTQFVDRIYELANIWRPRIIGIEQVALSTTLHYFNEKLRTSKQFWTTEPLRPKNRNKKDRIRLALQPKLAHGRLFVPMAARTLRSQIDFFPNITEDGEIDCVAYFNELARTPSMPETDEEVEKIIKDTMSARNSVTGY